MIFGEIFNSLANSLAEALAKSSMVLMSKPLSCSARFSPMPLTSVSGATVGAASVTVSSFVIVGGVVGAGVGSGSIFVIFGLWE